jgi:hypothetical protein
LSVKATPPGNAPLSTSDGWAGKVWLVVTVKLPALPPVKVALAALLIVGASFIVREKLWVASVPAPLCAVIVKE